MAETATQLITQAYYLANIVARDNETVSGSQLSDGLRQLNALLSLKSITGRFIPYYQYYELNTEIGVEKYFIPNLIDIETLTFNIGSVRFPNDNRKRKRYFGSGRADNIQSLPVTKHVERTKGGANLYLYFIPNTVYPIKFIAKFGWTSVNYDDDLTQVFDDFYIDYLTYQLARWLCAHNGLTYPAEAKSILAEYHNELRDMVAMDLSLQKISTLQRGSSFNYADANLGRGWRP